MSKMGTRHYALSVERQNGKVVLLDQDRAVAKLGIALGGPKND
jgi:hypothetical protein